MPRKGENIYKRKDGRWEARYIHRYENGKAIYRYLYGKTYSEAKEKRRIELAKPENMRVSAVRQFANLEELCGRWLCDKQSAVKESTFARYNRIVYRYILPKMEESRLNRIDASLVNRFYDHLRKSLSASTVSNIIIIFKSIWKYGQENGYPCCQFKLPKEKLKTSQEITIIPTETRIKLENALKQKKSPAYIGILFTLYTGVRIGEICGLKWGDIDFENGYAVIHRTVERIINMDSNSKNKTKVIFSEPKTNNSARVIPLPTFLLDYLEPYRRGDKAFLLTGSEKFIEPHTYYSRYKTFLRNHQLGDYTFHELRHTFATRCVERGFDIKSLSEILGHADVRMTMNLYVHPTLQMKKRQMEMLAPPTCSPSK